MGRTSEVWVYREAWRAFFRQGGCEFSDGPTWLGGRDAGYITLEGHCSTSGQPFLVLGTWFATACDEYKKPLNGAPGPVFVAVGPYPAVQPYSPGSATQPPPRFQNFCAEDTWPACIDCGQGIAPCPYCGELVCMFMPDSAARFPTAVRPRLRCPNCGQTLFDGTCASNAPLPPAPAHGGGGAGFSKRLPENRSVYISAWCSTHNSAFLIQGYEVHDVPDPTLGLTDPAPMYPDAPFFHVMGSVRREHARPGVPVRRFRSFNIEVEEPDCPLCGRRTTVCYSCGAWFCALEYRANPLRSLKYVVSACPQCGKSIPG